MELSHCPHCETTLDAEEIPVESREAFGNHTHFRREIGIQIHGAYDGVLFWQCPECTGRWHRWPEGHELYLEALKHINTRWD